jgi:hypothetical protein
MVCCLRLVYLRIPFPRWSVSPFRTLCFGLIYAFFISVQSAVLVWYSRWVHEVGFSPRQAVVSCVPGMKALSLMSSIRFLRRTLTRTNQFGVIEVTGHHGWGFRTRALYSGDRSFNSRPGVRCRLWRYLLFSLFSSVLPGKCRDIASNLATTNSSCILSNTLFTIHPIIWLCAIYAIETLVKQTKTKQDIVNKGTLFWLLLLRALGILRVAG